MRRVINHARRFLVSEDGPTAVEYAVLLSMIVVAAYTAISTLGSKMVGVFEWELTQLDSTG